MLKIRDAVRRWLGTDMVKSYYSIQAELAAIRLGDNRTREMLAQLRDESTRTRKLIAENFHDLKPASNEFIGVMFQQQEARLDAVMIACDQMKEMFQRSMR